MSNQCTGLAINVNVTTKEQSALPKKLSDQLALETNMTPPPIVQSQELTIPTTHTFLFSTTEAPSNLNLSQISQYPRDSVNHNSDYNLKTSCYNEPGPQLYPITKANSSSEIYSSTELCPDSGCKVFRTSSKTFMVKSCSIPDFQTAPNSPTGTEDTWEDGKSLLHIFKKEDKNKIKASLPYNRDVDVLQPSDDECSSRTSQNEDADDNKPIKIKRHYSIHEGHIQNFFSHPFSFFNRKIHDAHIHTGLKAKGFLHKEKSKSMTHLSNNKPSELISKVPEKPSNPWPIPSFHFSLHKEKQKLKKEQVDNVSADTPGSTPLVVPQQQSGAPTIFLFENTPEGSPTESPINTPNRTLGDTLQSSLDDDLSLGSGPKCIEDILMMKKISSRSNSEEEEDEGSGKKWERPGEDKRRASKVSFRCLSNIKKCVSRRPTIQIQSPPPIGMKAGESLEHDPLPRRPSMLSSLSVSMPARRPSMTSLLSVSPSVSMAGRRFSFTIGSRVRHTDVRQSTSLASRWSSLN